MYRRIFNLIPSAFRQRGWVLALNIMLRAVLNFFGVALLIPLLILILDQEELLSDGRMATLYGFFGCESYRDFALLIVCAIVLIVIVKSVINLWLYRYERDYIYDLYKSISRLLYIDYFSRGMGFVRQNNSAELSRRINLISLNFVVGVVRPMAVIAGELFLLGLIIIALALYDALAVVVAILLLIPAAWAYYRFIRRRISRYGREENEAHKMRFRSVTECFRGCADVEVNNAFGHMLSMFDDYTNKLVRTQKRNAMLSMMPNSLMEVAVVVGMALLVVLGLYLPMTDVKIVFGVFAVATVRLMPSVRSLLSSYTSISQNSYTLDILSDLVNVKLPMKQNDRLRLRDMLELRDLCFSYKDEAVINGLNVVIRRGDRVGIKGVSGRGKSTLMNLMLGLLEPTSGSILIDGVPLQAENRRGWQNSVGYVPQNLFLLDASLKENIAFGIEPQDIDHDRLHRAISMASLESLVDFLPDGVESNVGESGCRLSGGERQRIGIARALYRDPDVLFMDEATSALDNETEEQINLSIKDLSARNPDLTIVVIAHRTTSLDFCDYIITL